MRQDYRGIYPPDWPRIASQVKAEAGNCCIRCGHPNDPTSGHMLTVHHLDTDKSNVRWYNLVALCQRCHLSVQARVIMARPWLLPHSEWMHPYVAGYYAFKYLGEELTRPEVMARLPELLGLERAAIIGTEQKGHPNG